MLQINFNTPKNFVHSEVEKKNIQSRYEVCPRNVEIRMFPRQTWEQELRNNWRKFEKSDSDNFKRSH